ncbi:MAG: hypothetical protein HDR21_08320 [Lachnospiraceae bacterium]|nr:hypothetical protein [Lachnospiraceae bacterium]MBD5483015.1 hypothetical protein [Lachnospiraceae bacterium]
MIWVWIILFLAPGYLVMEMIRAGKRPHEGSRRKWIPQVLCILCDALIFGSTYFVFQYLRGNGGVHFHVEYQEKVQGYTIFDNAFVIQYALVELILAVGIGIAGRIIVGRKFKKRVTKA